MNPRTVSGLEPANADEGLRLVIGDLVRNPDVLASPNDDFGDTQKAAATYFRLGWSTVWIRDDGTIDRDRVVRRTLAIVANSLAIAETSVAVANEVTPLPEWRRVPRFSDGEIVSFIFHGCGDVPRKDVLGRFIVTSYPPCPQGFESTFGRYVVVPPSDGLNGAPLKWQVEPTWHHQLKPLPQNIRQALKSETNS